MAIPSDPAYQEVFVRWFQYGTFCPIFRTHGARPANELWSYGPRAQQILTGYDRLRYRLLPYIYSLAWKVTSEGYTPMRALVMDFPADRKALDIADEFMFGPALLVEPGHAGGSDLARQIYLPAGPTWYDFWTWRRTQRRPNGQCRSAARDYPSSIVRAGSIVPMGPELQYTSEKPADPIELRIYRGADGAFTLYEDDGESYAYEKGAYSTISFRWNESTRELTIDARRWQLSRHVAGAHV